jgi:hypothetical protein
MEKDVVAPVEEQEWSQGQWSTVEEIQADEEIKELDSTDKISVHINQIRNSQLLE